ncbi:MAG TPA: class I SAM-dependent methyltransferase [Polyangiaceae bacterium]|nr:class I SAM-dependent methyltransferase [Polyangiaceae bacterium]
MDRAKPRRGRPALGEARARAAPAPAKLARPDPRFEAGSRAHYEDPVYYEHAYRDRGDDVAFYVALARRTGGPVLEYGVGSGRIALPVARAGLRVDGVDASGPMLAALGARLEGEPAEVRRRVRAYEGDMRSLSLGRRYALVVCGFNTFLHLYERADAERFLARVRRHLAPGGRFALDVSVPHPADLARDPDRAHRTPRFRHPSAGRVVRYAEYFDYDPVRQVLLVTMEFAPEGGGPGWVVPLAHRQYFPAELEALLAYNGFEAEAVYGGFGGEPLGRDSDAMVWVCRAARAPVKKLNGPRRA